MRRTVAERTDGMGFTHFDENGKAVMVDVTAKSETVREARGDNALSQSP